MPDDADIELVTRFLRDHVGLAVFDLRHKQSLGASSDLAASDANEKYLIEVGGFDDPESQSADTGDVPFASSPYHYLDQVTKKMRRARQQLKGSAAVYAGHIWLLALLARSTIDPDHMREQIMGTVYGMADIEQHRATGARPRYRCLYFNESGFHRHPELHGVLSIAQGQIALYLNDFAPLAERLQRSLLCQFLAKHSALYDKFEWENRGELVADFPGDRKDKDLMLAKLNKKYPDRDLQVSSLRHYRPCL
jgi:hypothetical protein